MKNLTVMLKPASSLCNLRCKYCFYADVAKQREVVSFGMMSQDTVDRILMNVHKDLDAGDTITFAFQGGEPTLAGLDFYRYFVAQTALWKGIHVNYTIQTNGLLLDETWCVFLREHNFLVGISWDVLPDCHDQVRVSESGKGTAHAVMHAIALLKQYGVAFNVLCTLTQFVAKHPVQVWRQLIKNEIAYVQFTPCLAEMNTTKENPYALTPQRFAAFYDRIFMLWYNDFQKGKYRSVKLIDDIVNLLAFGLPTACGINGRCSPQIVVEADGSVYPCDFYCIDTYCLGNLAKMPLKEVYQSPVAKEFMNRLHLEPKLCGTCEFRIFCGGNCKRMQAEICCTPEGDFCGYQTLLRKYSRQFQQFALQQRQYRRS